MPSPGDGDVGKATDLPIGGIIGFSAVSSAIITFLSFRHKEKNGGFTQGKKGSASMTPKSENRLSCGVCKGKGFYRCRLCKGNAAIEWNPLYNPVFINPCLCPTCDGNRIQRCLNCLGNGFVRQNIN